MKPELDITMTAVCRPDVVERTLKSLQENLCEVEPRLVLHVDPVFGDQPERIVELASEYFSIARSQIGGEGHSYSKAVSWCWSNVESDIFLNWEDDWILLRPLDAERCIQIMEDHNRLNTLILDRADASMFDEPIGKPRLIDKDGVEVREHWNMARTTCQCYRRRKDIELTPSFIERKWAGKVAPHLNTRRLPKKAVKRDGQLRDQVWKGEKWLYTQGNGRLVEDIGRTDKRGSPKWKTGHK